MRRSALVFTALTVAFFGLHVLAADEKNAIDDEGFIKTWLLLAPIPLEENQSGADGLGKEQIKGEANLRPKEGDKVKAGNTELAWRKHQAKEHFFDFNAFLDKQVEDSVGYAVCYLVSDKDLADVKMKTGSDDQCKVWINGKLVLTQDQARPLEKDQDTTDVALKKGINTIVFKVVNEKVDWSGCVRFTDKDGNNLRNFKVQLSPN